MSCCVVVTGWGGGLTRLFGACACACRSRPRAQGLELYLFRAIPGSRKVGQDVHVVSGRVEVLVVPSSVWADYTLCCRVPSSVVCG